METLFAQVLDAEPPITIADVIELIVVWFAYTLSVTIYSIRTSPREFATPGWIKKISLFISKTQKKLTGNWYGWVFVDFLIKGATVVLVLLFIALLASLPVSISHLVVYFFKDYSKVDPEDLFEPVAAILGLTIAAALLFVELSKSRRYAEREANRSEAERLRNKLEYMACQDYGNIKTLLAQEHHRIDDPGTEQNVLREVQKLKNSYLDFTSEDVDEQLIRPIKEILEEFRDEQSVARTLSELDKSNTDRAGMFSELNDIENLESRDSRQTNRSKAVRLRKQLEDMASRDRDYITTLLVMALLRKHSPINPESQNSLLENLQTIKNQYLKFTAKEVRNGLIDPIDETLSGFKETSIKDALSALKDSNTKRKDLFAKLIEIEHRALRHSRKIKSSKERRVRKKLERMASRDYEKMTTLLIRVLVQEHYPFIRRAENNLLENLQDLKNRYLAFTANNVEKGLINPVEKILLKLKDEPSINEALSKLKETNTKRREIFTELKEIEKI